MTQRWTQLIDRKNTQKSLEKAEKAKDAKALRSLLLTAEEMFEEDSDGGDKVLRGARELLATLEADAKSRRIEERKFMMKQLSEAEAAKDENRLRNQLTLAEKLFGNDSDGGDSVLQSGRELLCSLENERKSKLLEDARTLRNSATRSSCGRGRGVDRTLPAWMTSGDDGPIAIADVCKSDETELVGKYLGGGRGG